MPDKETDYEAFVRVLKASRNSDCGADVVIKNKSGEYVYQVKYSAKNGKSRPLILTRKQWDNSFSGREIIDAMKRAEAVDDIDGDTSHGDSLVVPVAFEVSPPAAPSGFIVSLLTDPDKAEDFLANLEEFHFPRWVKRHGELGARAIWHAQCVIRVWDHWVTKAAKLLPWAKLL